MAAAPFVTKLHHVTVSVTFHRDRQELASFGDFARYMPTMHRSWSRLLHRRRYRLRGCCHVLYACPVTRCCEKETPVARLDPFSNGRIHAFAVSMTSAKFQDHRPRESTISAWSISGTWTVPKYLHLVLTCQSLGNGILSVPERKICQVSLGKNT
jgi:hypothetical protein